MAELTLPPVAQKVYTECKKCSAERYHVVLAHTSSTAAKVQCEVCGAKKTYKLPTAKPKKTGTGKPRKSSSAEARKSAHETEYKQMLDTAADADTQAYSMKTKFAQNQKVKHPKFGLGIIKSTQYDKIEVVFEDEVRLLVHNRP